MTHLPIREFSGCCFLAESLRAHTGLTEEGGFPLQLPLSELKEKMSASDPTACGHVEENYKRIEKGIRGLLPVIHMFCEWEGEQSKVFYFEEEGVEQEPKGQQENKDEPFSAQDGENFSLSTLIDIFPRCQEDPAFLKFVEDKSTGEVEKGCISRECPFPIALRGACRYMLSLICLQVCNKRDLLPTSEQQAGAPVKWVLREKWFNVLVAGVTGLLEEMDWRDGPSFSRTEEYVIVWKLVKIMGGDLGSGLLTEKESVRRMYTFFGLIHSVQSFPHVYEFLVEMFLPLLNVCSFQFSRSTVGSGKIAQISPEVQKMVQDCQNAVSNSHSTVLTKGGNPDKVLGLLTVRVGAPLYYGPAKEEVERVDGNFWKAINQADWAVQKKINAFHLDQEEKEDRIKKKKEECERSLKDCVITVKAAVPQSVFGTQMQEHLTKVLVSINNQIAVQQRIEAIELSLKGEKKADLIEKNQGRLDELRKKRDDVKKTLVYTFSALQTELLGEKQEKLGELYQNWLHAVEELEAFHKDEEVWEQVKRKWEDEQRLRRNVLFFFCTGQSESVISFDKWVDGEFVIELLKLTKEEGGRRPMKRMRKTLEGFFSRFLGKKMAATQGVGEVDFCMKWVDHIVRFFEDRKIVSEVCVSAIHYLSRYVYLCVSDSFCRFMELIFDPLSDSGYLDQQMNVIEALCARGKEVNPLFENGLLDCLPKKVKAKIAFNATFYRKLQSQSGRDYFVLRLFIYCCIPDYENIFLQCEGIIHRDFPPVGETQDKLKQLVEILYADKDRFYQAHPQLQKTILEALYLRIIGGEDGGLFPAWKSNARLTELCLGFSESQKKVFTANARSLIDQVVSECQSTERASSPHDDATMRTLTIAEGPDGGAPVMGGI